MRVAIALNHLRRNECNTQSQFFANALFHFRTEMRRVADGAGNFSNRHLRGRIAETSDVALIFRKPVGDLQPECNWLGMNPVSTADLRRVPKLVRAKIKNFAEQNKFPLDDARSVANHQGLRGVDNVVRSQSVVQPARRSGIADRFTNVHGERDDVVLHAGFEFVNARDIDFGALADRRGGLFRHESSLGKRLGGRQLDIEPFLEAVRVAPDVTHLFAGVAWDQTVSPRNASVAPRESHMALYSA